MARRPVSLNWDQALAAFERGTVDGQENPIATLIIPYKLWTVHNHITLWHYMIDPLILAVSAKTWASLSAEDRDTVRQVGSVIMELQKDEARDAPVKPAKIVELLQDMYGMQVARPSPIELDAFRHRTRDVYAKWAREIGMNLAGSVERIVESSK